MRIGGDGGRYSYPVSFTGNRARIETRLYDMDWPILMLSGQPESCNADGMNPTANGVSRSIIWFETTVVE